MWREGGWRKSDWELEGVGGRHGWGCWVEGIGAWEGVGVPLAPDRVERIGGGAGKGSRSECREGTAEAPLGSHDRGASSHRGGTQY